MHRREALASATRDAMPIILAYFPIAITFGVISKTGGIPWYITLLISVLIYAGGAQFMLVGLVLAHTAPLSIIITVLLANLRHFLYGTTLGPSLSDWAESHKWISAFGLTDEVFAITISRSQVQPPTPLYQIAFGLACYASWVSGTVVGTGIGSIVPQGLASVLNFALPALFLALLFLGKRSLPHMIAGFSGAAVACAATLLQWGSLSIVFGALLGSTVGMGIFKFRNTLKSLRFLHQHL